MIALAVFAAAALLAFWDSRRHAYDSDAHWRAEVRISLTLGAAALLIELALPARASPTAWPAGVLLALGVFLADDFLYYVSHRLAHRVSFFWASHAVHHSPVRYDLFTGLRQPPTWLLTPAAAAPVLLLTLGAPPALVAASATLRALHHFLIHTERVRRLPRWLEHIFNTPSHHRVHHSAEPAFLDKNFGGVLIVWDRLFGTFCAEPAHGVQRYGLVHAAGPGALAAFADPWRRLFARVGNAPSLALALRTLLAPPSHNAWTNAPPNALRRGDRIPLYPTPSHRQRLESKQGASRTIRPASPHAILLSSPAGRREDPAPNRAGDVDRA